MDKCCRTCKWYHNQECRNLGIKISLSDIQHYLDSGVTFESIGESGLFKDLMSNYKKGFQNLDMLKKKLPKDYEQNMEKEEYDYISMINEVVEDIIRAAFNNMDLDISINHPESFNCSNWE